VFSVTTDEVEEPGGVRTRRDVIRHSGSIVVLAVDDGAKAGRKAEPRILIERQYRHAAQSMMWELPAGRIDDGETSLTAAKRELLEETGYSARQWKRILHFYVSPGFLDETMTIYLARGLQAGEAQPEPDRRSQSGFSLYRRRSEWRSMDASATPRQSRESCGRLRRRDQRAREPSRWQPRAPQALGDDRRCVTLSLDSTPGEQHNS
jgi:8-oxo-dGTP pyrophosphatase MutT (NUDIX family)